MKKLSKPLQNTKPEDIFEECVSSYRDKKKVACLIKCKGLVQSDAVLYDKVVPSELDKFPLLLYPVMFLVMIWWMFTHINLLPQKVQAGNIIIKLETTFR